jgi:maltooligosyltrehalose trehalohydrolase
VSLQGAVERERTRRLPVGVELVNGGAHARVWAPDHQRVELVLDGGASHVLDAEGRGYFSGFVRGMAAGALYWFRLGDHERLLPDPVSRFQPDGVHGPSMLIDPQSFRWTDRDFRGVKLEDAIIYELHVGTFTPQGSWAAATRELERLAELGVNVLELMPVAEFAGEFGWGYDGVNLFAPTRLYGTPDDMRRFVDRAHHLGLSVVLDVSAPTGTTCRASPAPTSRRRTRPIGARR